MSNVTVRRDPEMSSDQVWTVKNDKTLLLVHAQLKTGW